jgi:hypothetical protein
MVNYILPDNKGSWVYFEDTTCQLTILSKRTIGIEDELVISLTWFKIESTYLLGLGVVLSLHFYSFSEIIIFYIIILYKEFK